MDCVQKELVSVSQTIIKTKKELDAKVKEVAQLLRLEEVLQAKQKELMHAFLKH